MPVSWQLDVDDIIEQKVHRVHPIVQRVGLWHTAMCHKCPQKLHSINRAAFGGSKHMLAISRRRLQDQRYTLLLPVYRDPAVEVSISDPGVLGICCLASHWHRRILSAFHIIKLCIFGIKPNRYRFMSTSLSFALTLTCC